MHIPTFFIYDLDDLGVLGQRRLDILLADVPLSPSDRLINVQQKQAGSNVRSRIDRAISQTQVTVLIIGTYTFERKWVRYAIAKSFACSRGLLAVHTYNIDDGWDREITEGPSPFDYFAYRIKNKRVTVLIRDVLFEITWRPTHVARNLPLAALGYPLKRNYNTFDNTFLTYGWTLDNGPANFLTWVTEAAAFAGQLKV